MIQCCQYAPVVWGSIRTTVEENFACPQCSGCHAALGALAPHLPPDLLPNALESARTIANDWTWARALRDLAPHLAAAAAGDASALWHTTIRTLSAHGRPGLLNDLVTLLPWLEALASPEELAEVAQAVVDVARCWP